MEAVIVNYRRSRHTQAPNQLLLSVAGVHSRKTALPLVGKKVVWISPAKKQITGKISGPHGNRGVVRVRFSRGLPGEALGQKVRIQE
jgi:large subunit ribosomal protein L35Ae